MAYGLGETPNGRRGKLIEAHIADLHFGAFDPKAQFDLLSSQFLDKISLLPKLDIIAVDGDIFDHKVMSNSDTVMYASLFVDRLAQIARDKNSTLVIIHGTFSHDYDQLKIFYHYLEDPTLDIRIITDICFQNIKGARILCIPELYGVDESVYRKAFFESGWYDAAFVHGTFQGAVYGDNVGNGRLLTPEDFIYCTGMVIAGHVHKSGCFSGFFYYCGCPYRWKFNEEEDKGFLFVVHDLDTQVNYVGFEPVNSALYETIYLDELISEDPKVVVEYINNLKNTKGIDYLKIRFRVPVAGYNRTIINNFYRNNPAIFVEFMTQEEVTEQKIKQDITTNSQFSYLTDPSISDLERFVRYVNESEGCEYITVQKLSELLNESI